MPRKPQTEKIQCQYYAWIMRSRNGVFYADGRSNVVDLKKHSLETRDRKEAEARLRQLDLVKAVENGLAEPSLLRQDREKLLPLEDGRLAYLEHVRRPAIRGGGSPDTLKRYRTVLDKFLAFARSKGLQFWQQVTKATLDGYNRWMEDNDYHDKTQYTELNVVKQILKWMVGEGLLPPSCLFRYPLQKPTGTSRYCYTHAEVSAIVAYCRADSSRRWLGDAVVALAQTGLRIGELAALEWSDVDMVRWVITLTDTTRRSRKSERHAARTTKSHRDRSLAVHDDLKAVLRGLRRHSDNRVFHGPKGGRLSPDKTLRALKKALEALKDRFPAADGRRGMAAGGLHSFRHYFCSCSADSGVPEQMLMSWLGHRESEMIRHYYHQRGEESQRQMGRLPSVTDAGEPGVGREEQTSGGSPRES